MRIISNEENKKFQIRIRLKIYSIMYWSYRISIPILQYSDKMQSNLFLNCSRFN